MTPKFSFNMIVPAANVPRLGTSVFAWGLGLGAVWILSVELIRPSLPVFPNDAATIESAAARRNAAGVAAWIGLLRGSLWTAYAMTLAPAPSGEFTDKGASSVAALDSTRTAAVRAAELAPHDARAWLLIAEVDSRGLEHNAAGPLKMSYYTGPNELPLIPMRIKIATGTDAITDSELQILVGGEIRKIITRRPDLKPLIIAAYRSALPEGRRFIESQVSELDPALLASIRAIDAAR
jgi:hypothetical protein